MKKSVQKLRSNRIFSEQFRRSRVEEYESGEMTVLEIARTYGVSSQSVYRWIHQYSVYEQQGLKIVEHSQSKSRQIEQLKKQLAEMERLLGRKQIQVEYLEEMIELAREEHGIDLKKNSDTPPSNA